MESVKIGEVNFFGVVCVYFHVRCCACVCRLPVEFVQPVPRRVLEKDREELVVAKQQAPLVKGPRSHLYHSIRAAGISD